MSGGAKIWHSLVSPIISAVEQTENLDYLSMVENTAIAADEASVHLEIGSGNF